jgi:protein-disulfide isomerase
LRTFIAGIVLLSSLVGGLVLAQTATPKKPAPAPPAAPAKQTTAAGAPASKPNEALPTKETVDSFIRHYFGYNPSFTWKVDAIQAADVPGLAEVMVTYTSGEQKQRMRFYVSADGKHAIFGDAMPFGADPFATERRTLERKANGPARGATKPAVLIVEFADLQCPHCKEAGPTLERLAGDEPQAKFVFQSFPLPNHDWAQKAAQYADCIAQKNEPAFWKFVDGVFAAQEMITAAEADAKLTELAVAAGVDGRATAACAALPATAARVKQSFDLGREVDVSGTPTVFINGRRISAINSLPYEELKAIVDYEVQLAAQPAGK